MKCVLITGVGGDIGSAIARCLRDEYGREIRICGCDVDPINQGLLYVDDFFEAPRAASEEYIDFLLRLHQDIRFDLLIPSTEPEIERLSRERPPFEQLGIKLMMNEPAILQVFSRKSLTAEALQGIGVNVPDTVYSLESLKESTIAFPVIVKEDAGCGSRGLRVAESVKEAEKALGQMSDPIIQQYVGSENEEYTVGVFSDGERTECIAFRRKLGFGGMTVKAECVEIPEIEEMASAIAESFALRGAINVQLRKEDGKFYVFEINPRLSSTVRLRYKAGFKDCIWWLEMLLCGNPRIEYKPIGRFVGVKILDDALFEYSNDGTLAVIG